jgi:hypothetical protein
LLHGIAAQPCFSAGYTIKKGRLENRPAGHALKAIALTLFNYCQKYYTEHELNNFLDKLQYFNINVIKTLIILNIFYFLCN